jgi:acyl carrier protein
MGVFILLASLGCASKSDPPQGPNNPGDSAEKSVRTVIGELLKVDPASIAMDCFISDPPLKADELDLVEIVMELEDRNNVEFSDEAIEKHLGGKLGGGGGPARITPNQLALILRAAPKMHRRGKGE